MRKTDYYLSVAMHNLYKYITSRKELLALAVIAFILFFLQSRFLHVAAYPETDEGIYAEAGRMMLNGFVPHEDFPIWHMPLLPALIGIGLKIFGSMYPLRLIFLFLNCFAAIPLFLTFKKINKNSAIALLAVLFYVTFHEMVHHDFRFLALRQTANIFFIMFFYLSICRSKWKWTPILQGLLIVASAFLFLPTAFNFLLLVGALLVYEPNYKKRVLQLKNYIIIAAVAIIALLLYFLLIPNSADQVILDQLNRSSMDRLHRLELMFFGKFDAFFYSLSIVSLVIASVISNKLRSLSLAMLGIIALSALLPSFYYPHYISIAGPALAFGIFTFGILIYKACELLNLKGSLIPFTIFILIFAHQFTLGFDSLVGEWSGNRKPDYYAFIDKLAKTPEPLLAMEPIYAVDADRKLVRDPIESYFRSPNPKRSFSNDDYNIMVDKACTIILESKASSFFPYELRNRWEKQFISVEKNNWGTILLTENPHCQTNF